MTSVVLKPIGHIESDFVDPREIETACEDGIKCGIKSQVVVYDEFIEGLQGLSEFSHAFIIYHLDKADHVEMITHPGPSSIKNLKKVGVFASRSQYRPNHIAVRLVKLIKLEGNRIFVEGLDGIDKSPVLDIKPYVPGFDRPDEFSFADWYNWLEK